MIITFCQSLVKCKNAHVLHLEYRMFIVQGRFSSSSKVWKRQKTVYTSCTRGYIYTEVNHTIYVRRGPTSAVYFIYKSRDNI